MHAKKKVKYCGNRVLAESSQRRAQVQRKRHRWPACPGGKSCRRGPYNTPKTYSVDRFRLFPGVARRIDTALFMIVKRVKLRVDGGPLAVEEVPNIHAVFFAASAQLWQTLRQKQTTAEKKVTEAEVDKEGDSPKE